MTDGTRDSTLTSSLLAGAYVDRVHMAGPEGRLPWNPGGEDVPPDGRIFFPDWPRFSRADRPSRFVLAASTRLPAALPVAGDRIAVILGSRTGCLDADRAFAASRADRPLPSVYARTLPSTPGAELAILRHCTGPNFAIVQDAAPGLRAVAAAMSALAAGACDLAFAGAYDAVEGAEGSGWACLWLLGRTPAPVRVTLSRMPSDAEPEAPSRNPLMDAVDWMYDPAAPEARRLDAIGGGSRLVATLERQRGGR